MVLMATLLAISATDITIPLFYNATYMLPILVPTPTIVVSSSSMFLPPAPLLLVDQKKKTKTTHNYLTYSTVVVAAKFRLSLRF